MDNAQIESWILEEPMLNDAIKKAQDIYKGPIKFIKSGRKTYVAKLDPVRLMHNISNVKEAFFELNLSKKKNNIYKDFFFLKLVDSNKDVNTIKIF